MPNVNIRISPAEASIIASRMLLEGDTNKSEHVRRVYFQAATGQVQGTAELRREVQVLTETVDLLKKTVQKLAVSKSDGLELRLLSGLCMLLYPSVDPSVQAVFDQYLDIATVESFVADGKSKGKR